jgi:hypothetical protein
MALLLTSVFGVTGCGSDDDVDVESRVKNIAPEASGASDAPSQADCDALLDLRGLLSDRDDPRFQSLLFELLALVVDVNDFYDIVVRFDDLGYQCDAAWDVGEAMDDESDSGEAIDDESDSGTAIDDESDSGTAIDDESDSGTDSVTTTPEPYVDEVPPCVEGREVENSEECLP